LKEANNLKRYNMLVSSANEKPERMLEGKEVLEG
jgi:hypothetical protein